MSISLNKTFFDNYGISKVHDQEVLTKFVQIYSKDRIGLLDKIIESFRELASWFYLSKGSYGFQANKIIDSNEKLRAFKDSTNTIQDINQRTKAIAKRILTEAEATMQDI